MKYRNTKTGAVICTHCKVTGETWEPLPDGRKRPRHKPRTRAPMMGNPRRNLKAKARRLPPPKPQAKPPSLPPSAAARKEADPWTMPPWMT